MATTSTIGGVYHYTGSLLTLQTGGLLNVSALNTASGPLGATFIDDDGRLDQSDDGQATVSINGGPAQAIDYIGAGTASTVTLLGLKLGTVPAMAFEVDGSVYIHFPSGLPPLSGILISFDIKPGNGFDLPNPMPICLAADTVVLTDRGEVAAGRLRPGDRLLTLDSGAQTVRMVARRHVGIVEQRLEPRLRGMRIAAAALGDGLPRRALTVTRQHRILLRLPGGAEAMAPARMLTVLPGIAPAPADRPLTFVHLVLDRHEVIFAEGCATETLFAGAQALLALPAEERAAIRRLGLAPQAPARRFLSGREFRQALPGLRGIGPGPCRAAETQALVSQGAGGGARQHVTPA